MPQSSVEATPSPTSSAEGLDPTPDPSPSTEAAPSPSPEEPHVERCSPQWAVQKLSERGTIAAPSRVYLTRDIPAGSRIVLESEPRGEIPLPEQGGPFYVALVDDHPFQNWDHPVRYAYVDCATETVQFYCGLHDMHIQPPYGEPPLPFTPDADRLAINEAEIIVGSGHMAALPLPYEKEDPSTPDGAEETPTTGGGSLARSTLAAATTGKCLNLSLAIDGGEVKKVWYERVLNENNADLIDDFLRYNNFRRWRRSQYWNSSGYHYYKAVDGDIGDQFLAHFKQILSQFRAEKERGLPQGCVPQLVLYVDSHGNVNSFGLYKADGSDTRFNVSFSNVIATIQEFATDHADALKEVRFYWMQESCASGGMIRAKTEAHQYNAVSLPAMTWKDLVDAGHISGVYLVTSTDTTHCSLRKPFSDTSTKDFWQGLKGRGDDGDGRSPGDWGDGFKYMVDEDPTDENRQNPQRFVYPERFDPEFFPLEGVNRIRPLGSASLTPGDQLFFSFNATELMQYRFPVGFGPSSKTWPR